MPTIWVLFWEYGDKSGSGVLRAYETEQRANKDFELLVQQDEGKNYKLVELEVYT